MKFIDIIKGINLNCKIISENSVNDINGIELNSKKSSNRDIFVAIKGFKTDGHLYISDSYINGCRDFVIERPEEIDDEYFKDSTFILVENSRAALAEISSYIFEYPSEKLNMIGVTGTKGKTTVVSLIHHIINSEGKASMFSTVKNIIEGESYDAERTTMESNELNRLLKRSKEMGDEFAVVEVSSHAVTLDRVHGLQFDLGVFTSFSRDHLDLYSTMEKYFEAKLNFFRMLNNSKKKNKIAVINIDDPKGEEVCNAVTNKVRIVRVGSTKNCDYYVKDYFIEKDGINILLVNDNKKYEFKSMIKGKFNISNIALAVATVMELGFPYENIKSRLKIFYGVEGRFEVILDNPFTIIVDYAHSPDSLEKILQEAKDLTSRRVILVFGCTGDRDRDKRSIMGKIAATYSDFAVITNDDTYSEDPLSIARELESGFLESFKEINRDYKIILDRKKAIREAIYKAESGDTIVIAGMGHEKVQILPEGPIPYNDKETVLELLKELNENK